MIWIFFDFLVSFYSFGTLECKYVFNNCTTTFILNPKVILPKQGGTLISSVLRDWKLGRAAEPSVLRSSPKPHMWIYRCVLLTTTSWLTQLLCHSAVQKNALFDSWLLALLTARCALRSFWVNFGSHGTTWFQLSHNHETFVFVRLYVSVIYFGALAN